jgi:hypothetical protein
MGELRKSKYERVSVDAGALHCFQLHHVWHDADFIARPAPPHLYLQSH